MGSTCQRRPEKSTPHSNVVCACKARGGESERREVRVWVADNRTVLPRCLVQDKSRQADEHCSIEIQPSMSCADTRHHAAGLAQQSDHSAFKSNQQACKADATSTTEAENVGADELSVFDSTPQKSAEAATAAGSMPNEQLMFESQPKRFRVHHRGRQFDVTLKREVGQFETTMRSKSSVHRRAGVYVLPHIPPITMSHNWFEELPPSVSQRKSSNTRSKAETR